MPTKRKVVKKAPTKKLVGDQFPMVQVEWEDISSYEEWKTLSEVKKLKPVIIHTMGRLVHETDDLVIIVPHLEQSEEGDILCGSTHCIMKSVIVSLNKM